MQATQETKLLNGRPTPWWTWVPAGLLGLLLLWIVGSLAYGGGDFELGVLLFSLGIVAVPQALLIGGIGLGKMADRPGDRIRWLPILVFASTVGFALFAVATGLDEFLTAVSIFPTALAAIFVISMAVALETWRRTRRTPRWPLLVRLSLLILAVSVVALVTNLVLHQWTTRRSAFLAGLGTAIGALLAVHVAAGSLIGLTVAGLTRNRYLRDKAVRSLTDQYCPVCDYDLRASPQRCPECGTPRERPGVTGSGGCR